MKYDVYIYFCKTPNGTFACPEGPRLLIRLYLPYCYNGKKKLRDVKRQFPHLWNSNIKYFIVSKNDIKVWTFSLFSFCPSKSISIRIYARTAAGNRIIEVWSSCQKIVWSLKESRFFNLLSLSPIQRYWRFMYPADHLRKGQSFFESW
jgi:hypothetical protein